MTERGIIDVYWQGPYSMEQCKAKATKDHVLYAFFGQHHMYGSNVLLYIGQSLTIDKRLARHNEWLLDEYDAVQVRIASIGEFEGWKTWEKDDDPYEQAKPELVREVEALLIYAHQPAYNSQSKASAPGVGLRLFNTGHIGPLLPEISYRYHLAEE